MLNSYTGPHEPSWGENGKRHVAPDGEPSGEVAVEECRAHEGADVVRGLLIRRDHIGDQADLVTDRPRSRLHDPMTPSRP